MINTWKGHFKGRCRTIYKSILGLETTISWRERQENYWVSKRKERITQNFWTGVFIWETSCALINSQQEALKWNEKTIRKTWDW